MTTIYDKDAKFTEYGELIEPEVPKVGGYATQVMYSDCHAYTISRVSKSGKTFWMKQDKAELLPFDTEDGCFNDIYHANATQKWKLTENPNAYEVRVNKTKNGWHSAQVGRVVLGHKTEFYDYTF